MSKQEIIPPRRNQVERLSEAHVTSRVPSVNMGDFIESTFSTWHHNKQTKAVNALTARHVAETALFRAQGAVVDEEIRLREKLFALQELPERLGHELALRRMAREESYSQAVHDFKQNELRREMEATYSEADLVRAQVVLVDAEQMLKAQRDYGYLNNELAHRKKATELLDVELDQVERRALLKKHFADQNTKENTTSSHNHTDLSEIDEALHAYRQQLNAEGLDTSRIDEVIRERRKR